MRRIKAYHIAIFMPMFFLSIFLGICSAVYLFGYSGILRITGYEAILVFISAYILVYLFAILFYRIFFIIFPLKTGEIPYDSWHEALANISVLFYLFLFHRINFSGTLPIPLTRTFYRLLGAKFGKNTYSGGMVADPPFFTIGKNCIIGGKSLIICHVLEGPKLGYYNTIIGDNVTIGANSTILANTQIGSGSIIAAGSVVKKGSRIGENEIWGGIPAKFIKLNKHD